MHTSCAQETRLYLRFLHCRRSLNSAQVQKDQRLLVIKNVFLVLVLAFHVISIGCRDKLRPSPSKRPDRLVDVDRSFRRCA